MGNLPDYKAIIEVPAWKNTAEDGTEYINIKLFGTTIRLHSMEPKQTTP